MACWIALDKPDSIVSIYCHETYNSSSPEKMLNILKEHYNLNKLNQLFELGGIYKLAPFINEENRRGDINFCMFLKRDYNNISYPTFTFMKKDDYTLNDYITYMRSKNHTSNYLIYINNKWMKIPTYTNLLIEA